jgi:DNA-binding response OmpR family regulator
MDRPARILICDDEPSLRELMRVALDPSHTFAEAADTASAIGLVESFQPDLVLLDMMMPGGSGLDVLAHLRASSALAGTEVVVVSAVAEPADRAAALEAGATAFVGKPFDPDELDALVSELLDARG